MLLHLTIYTSLLLLVRPAKGIVKLRVNPASGNVRLGDTVIFICRVEGGEVDSIEWHNSDGELVEETDHITMSSTEYSSQLRIINAVPDVGGTYWCRANADTKPIQKMLTVKVIQDPVFENQLEKQEFEEGSDAVVRCQVTGLPSPVVSWTFRQGNIKQSERYRIESTGNLVIRKIQALDGGPYECVATIAERNVRKVLKIDVYVNHVPTFVPVDPELLYSWLGNPVNISCRFRSYPRADVTWSRNGSDLGSNGHLVLAENSTEARSVLQLPVNSTEDFSEYRCTVNNSRGSVSRSTELREGGIPSAPREVRADPRSTTVEVSYSPPEHDGGIPILGYLVEWRRNSTGEWNRTRTDSEHSQLVGLDPYTVYQIRVAAFNGKGEGNYSDLIPARTLSLRGEPDRPVVSAGRESAGNEIRIVFEDVECGGRPVLRHFLRYKEAQADQWDSVTVNDSSSYLLQDLSWGSHYQLQIEAVNDLGPSLPSFLNFSTPQRPPSAAVGERPKVRTGGVVGIILAIFLALLVVVDAVCYRTRRCGIFMSLSHILLGRRMPRRKSLDLQEAASQGRT